MNPLDALLDRPTDQRRREYQYRFAQSAVFGLPVIVLHWFGRSLGGPETDRWVALLQALLAGWVVYVGAAGMLFEGIIRLVRRRLTADLLPALAAVTLYGHGVVRTVQVLVAPPTARPAPSPAFHWVVLILIVWTAARWGWPSSRQAQPGAEKEEPG